MVLLRASFAVKVMRVESPDTIDALPTERTELVPLAAPGTTTRLGIALVRDKAPIVLEKFEEVPAVVAVNVAV